MNLCFAPVGRLVVHFDAQFKSGRIVTQTRLQDGPLAAGDANLNLWSGRLCQHPESIHRKIIEINGL